MIKSANLSWKWSSLQIWAGNDHICKFQLKMFKSVKFELKMSKSANFSWKCSSLWKLSWKWSGLAIWAGNYQVWQFEREMIRSSNLSRKWSGLTKLPPPHPCGLFSSLWNPELISLCFLELFVIRYGFEWNLRYLNIIFSVGWQTRVSLL